MKRHRHPPRRAEPAGGVRLRAGAEVEVRVERILPGGVGLAHAEGQTLFVSLSAPGDLVRARVESVRGRLVFASVAEVLEPSPARVEPPCPYFGRCGGCDFQQLSYEAQLEAKAEIIRDCLRRVARAEPPEEITVEPSPEVWRYRARARWQHDPRRHLLGYYERGSHRVCDVADCPVAAPPVNERLKRLRDLMNDGRLPHAPEFEAVAGDEGVALDPTVEPGDAREQSRRVLDETYRFDAGCFFQINHTLLDALVAEGLRDTEAESSAGADDARGTALDLYSGVGLFTLPLARRFKNVIAVEGNPAAADYARRNLSDASLTNASVETSSVGDWLAANAGRLDANTRLHDADAERSDDNDGRPDGNGGRPGSVDFILLDPPRAGAEPEAVAGIIRLKPAHISYVSCDPATLARDLRALLDAGYTLRSLRAFDMFPQTHHVETVAHLRF